MVYNETPTKGIAMINFIAAVACILAVGAAANFIAHTLTK